jgi:hypothetical protein
MSDVRQNRPEKALLVRQFGRSRSLDRASASGTAQQAVHLPPLHHGLP